MTSPILTTVKLLTPRGLDVETPALVCGDWATHQQYRGLTPGGNHAFDGEWFAITHVPTGRKIPLLATEEAAISTIVALGPVKWRGGHVRCDTDIVRAIKRIVVEEGCVLL